MQPDFMYAAVAQASRRDRGLHQRRVIAKYDLVVLDDPGGDTAYDAIVLIAPKRAGDAALPRPLAPLLGHIDIAVMREANLRAAPATARHRLMRWRSGCGTRSGHGRSGCRSLDRRAACYELPRSGTRVIRKRATEEKSCP